MVSCGRLVTVKAGTQAHFTNAGRGCLRGRDREFIQVVPSLLILIPKSRLDASWPHHTHLPFLPEFSNSPSKFIASPCKTTMEPQEQFIHTIPTHALNEALYDLLSNSYRPAETRPPSLAATTRTSKKQIPAQRQDINPITCGSGSADAASRSPGRQSQSQTSRIAQPRRSWPPAWQTRSLCNPRTPLPNGSKQFLGSYLKFSSDILSGLNSSASSPHTARSLCNEGTKTTTA
ncbi:hypothetical protein B0T17DRAFT_352212 [Bombardia bombarda]|uniref:Uncharacterized protein n=1 Tax=Bombardia bombarda TaxID=252184 RepID=A0AA39WHW8_9PEZI|nr:hypothetical protein B0T17DRAFT_352212 [Bombardia bombarda]